MKKFLVIVFMGLLTGCASINYSDIENSEATVSNIKVVELGEASDDPRQKVAFREASDDSWQTL